MKIVAKINEPLQIQSYMHCGKCLDELPSGKSPKAFSKLAVGLTPDGIQVWCNRHNVNVAHVVLDAHTCTEG